MKNLAFITVLIWFLSLAKLSYAEEQKKLINASSPIASTFTINHSQLSQLLTYHDLTKANNYTVDAIEQQSQIQGSYAAGIVSFETGLIQSEQSSSWRKYYFSGAVTLHQQNAFNLSLTASIEQLTDVQVNSYQPRISDSFNIINDSELIYSYGLVGSYSVNSTWNFSGGIILSPVEYDSHNTTSYTNNHMALVGTTYSF